MVAEPGQGNDATNGGGNGTDGGNNGADGGVQQIPPAGVVPGVAAPVAVPPTGVAPGVAAIINQAPGDPAGAPLGQGTGLMFRLPGADPAAGHVCGHRRRPAFTSDRSGHQH